MVASTIKNVGIVTSKVIAVIVIEVKKFDF